MKGGIAPLGELEGRVSTYDHYTTPVDRLYLCSNGTWPAVYVSGLPGRNAAQKILDDLRGSSRAGRSERGDAGLAEVGIG